MSILFSSTFKIFARNSSAPRKRYILEKDGDWFMKHDRNACVLLPRSNGKNPYNLPGRPVIAGKQSDIDPNLRTDHRKVAHKISIQAFL